MALLLIKVNFKIDCLTIIIIIDYCSCLASSTEYFVPQNKKNENHNNNNKLLSLTNSNLFHKMCGLGMIYNLGFFDR